MAEPRPFRVRLSTGVTLSGAEQGEAGAPALILLHGYSDSWPSFVPLMQHLPRSLRVVAVSVRGHGDSDQPAEGYGLASLAADVAALLDALGIARAVVLGHSMGSLVATRFALDHPGRLDALVLIGAFRTLKGNAGFEEMCRDSIAGMTDPVDADFVRSFQESTLAVRLPDDFFATVLAESGKLTAQVWRAVAASLRTEDHSAELGRIAVPTLILWGDRDNFTGEAEQRALAAAIRGARLIPYANTGHALHWEQPERAASDIAAFLAGRR